MLGMLRNKNIPRKASGGNVVMFMANGNTVYFNFKKQLQETPWDENCFKTLLEVPPQGFDVCQM
jgi:hypothetical protein